ncbi:MAG: YdcH family protein [Methylophagaceae bacterium]
MAGYLQELYKKHRTLDEEIKVMYNTFASDSEINRLKTKKLWYKDEIHRLETRLKTI